MAHSVLPSMLSTKSKSIDKFSLSGNILFLAIFLFLQADLKVSINPYIHWFVAFITIAVLVLLGTKSIWKMNVPFQVLLTLVPFGMLLNFFLIRGSWYDIGQAVKILLIFSSVIVFYNFFNRYIYIKNALVVSLFVNVMFLLLAIILNFPTAKIMTGDGRWGTIFNFPGSLAKVGMLTLIYGLYGLIASKNRRLYYLLVLSCSLITIIMDGSRTALLGSALCVVLMFAILIMEYYGKQKHKSLKRTSLFLATIFLSGVIFYNIGGSVSERTIQFVSNIFSGDTQNGLKESDATRYSMLKTGMQAIAEHPYIGTGMGTTVAQISSGDLITVHLSYLQLWGDAGIIAFAFYVILCLYGLYTAFLGVYNGKKIIELDKRAFIYSMSVAVAYYIFNGFFHPFSTEWSEWIIFIMAVGVIIRNTSQKVE